MTRDDFGQVGAATRDAIERTLALDPPKPALRVLLALIHSHTTWSHLGEQTSRGRLMNLTGMSEAAVKVGINWLKANDIIIWIPGGQTGGGDRYLSLARFPLSQRGVDTRPGSKDNPGCPRDKGGSKSLPKGGRPPTPKRDTSSISEGRNRSAAPSGAAAAAPADLLEVKNSLVRTLDKAVPGWREEVGRADLHDVATFLAEVVGIPGIGDVLCHFEAWAIDVAEDPIADWSRPRLLQYGPAMAIEQIYDEPTLKHILTRVTRTHAEELDALRPPDDLDEEGVDEA